jgi:hypothetical protein
VKEEQTLMSILQKTLDGLPKKNDNDQPMRYDPDDWAGEKDSALEPAEGSAMTDLTAWVQQQIAESSEKAAAFGPPDAHEYYRGWRDAHHNLLNKLNELDAALAIPKEQHESHKAETPAVVAEGAEAPGFTDTPPPASEVAEDDPAAAGRDGSLDADHGRRSENHRAVGVAGLPAQPERDFSKWARLIVEQVDDIREHGQSEGLSALTLAEVFPASLYTAAALGGVPSAPPPRDVTETVIVGPSNRMFDNVYRDVVEAGTLPLKESPQQIAESIIRNHVPFCEGFSVPDAPWCSAAPDDHPLCPACAVLAQAIAAAIEAADRVVRSPLPRAEKEND